MESSTAVQRQAFGNVIVGFALACICVLATSVSVGGGPQSLGLPARCWAPWGA